MIFGKGINGRKVVWSVDVVRIWGNLWESHYSMLCIDTYFDTKSKIIQIYEIHKIIDPQKVKMSFDWVLRVGRIDKAVNFSVFRFGSWAQNITNDIPP